MGQHRGKRSSWKKKWGCNKWGLKVCLAALPGHRPNRLFSPFVCLCRPFPEGAKSTWEIQKTEEKGLFPQISSDLLEPPSLKPPFAALQRRTTLKSLTSLNKEVRPFFLSDKSTWSFPSISSLSDYSIWRSRRLFEPCDHSIWSISVHCPQILLSLRKNGI